MALKTFNIDNEIYGLFSKHCKKEGISMSRRIEKFIRSEVEIIKNPKSKEFDVKREVAKFDEKDKFHFMKKYC